MEPSFMLFLHASELAIQATLFLAQQPPGKLSPVHEIAVHSGASEPYLAKILQRLTAAGLVRAFRGPGRGLELGRAPEQINLGSIVRALEGLPLPERCILGIESCTEQNPCPLHERWIPLRNEIRQLLDETTVASLTRRPRDTDPAKGPYSTPGAQATHSEGSRLRKKTKCVHKAARAGIHSRKKLLRAPGQLRSDPSSRWERRDEKQD
jgi:Rrf2 family transcriptional regulator, iron-sulfur cluster assembly transcription factor